MNKTLRKITNTIVANLDNTEQLGFGSGKLGLCYYFYKYAEVYDSEKHEIMASKMLFDVFNEIANHIVKLSVELLSEMGIGLIMLLDQDLITDSKNNDILSRIDKIILKKPLTMIEMNKISEKTDICLPGLYILYRLKKYNINLEKSLIDNYVKEINEQLISPEDIVINSKTIYYWSSLLFVFKKMTDTGESWKEDAESIIKKLTAVLTINLEQHYFPHEVTLFLNHIVALPEKQNRNHNQLKEKYIFDYEHHIWNYIIYDWSEPKTMFRKGDYETFINDAIKNSFYSLMTVNNQLAAIGIWLLNKQHHI